MARPATVLLLSGDPMAAALLGLLAESAGFQAAFPLAGEPPEEAVARVRPLSVILVDSALDVTRSDLFYGRVARRRVGLAVLRRADDADLPLAAWAREREVPYLDVPLTPEQFAHIVETAHASNWWRSDRDRRRAPGTESASDGTLVYVDRSGRRWKVYDRRSDSPRRAADRQDLEGAQRAGAAERLFVGEDGDTWQCTLSDGEHVNGAPSLLERQFARAVRLEPGPARSDQA